MSAVQPTGSILLFPRPHISCTETRRSRHLRQNQSEPIASWQRENCISEKVYNNQRWKKHRMSGWSKAGRENEHNNEAILVKSCTKLYTLHVPHDPVSRIVKKKREGKWQSQILWMRGMIRAFENSERILRPPHTLRFFSRRQISPNESWYVRVACDCRRPVLSCRRLLKTGFNNFDLVATNRKESQGIAICEAVFNESATH